MVISGVMAPNDISELIVSTLINISGSPSKISSGTLYNVSCLMLNGRSSAAGSVGRNVEMEISSESSVSF